MPRWLKNTFLAAVVVGGSYYAYTHYYHPAAGGPGDMGGAPPVSVAVVEARKVQLWNEFSGRLVAVDSAEIRPRVSGTIEAIHFKEGEWVEKGAPLFTIDQKPYAATLQSAQARATLAEAELGRAKSLVADKAIPEREYDQRKNDAEVARADLTRAKLDYDYSVIKAPVAGRVGRAEITVGNLVDAGGNAPILTTVVSNKPIYADFDIDEQTYLHYLKSAGDDQNKLKNVAVNLGLSGEKGAPHAGHVQSFDNRLNVGSGTLRVRAVFGNEDGSLIPGLFARMQLGAANNNDVILINDHAINTDQSVKFVWVVGEDNKVMYRPVKLGGVAEGMRVITDGLKPGEKIVINGIQRVMMPGQAITPKIIPMDGKDPAAAEGQAPAQKPEDAAIAEKPEAPEAAEKPAQ